MEYNFTKFYQFGNGGQLIHEEDLEEKFYEEEADKAERQANLATLQQIAQLAAITTKTLEALVHSTIQVEGRINQANENRKRRMMLQNGPNNLQKYRPSSSTRVAPRPEEPLVQMPLPKFNNVTPPRDRHYAV